MGSARARWAVVRRAAGVLAVAALLAGAVMFYRMAPTLPTAQADPATPSATTPATSSPPTPSTTASNPTPTRPAAAPAPRPTNTNLPRGPGTTDAGIYLTATPASDGTFDVSEMVVLAKPADTITIQPPDVAGLGGDFGQAQPRASQVQVSAGDQPVVIPEGSLESVTTVGLTTPVDAYELRYQLSGVTMRSVPSTAGRALGALGPLTAGVPGDLPVQIAVNGTSVRNLQCPSLRLSQQACATGELPRLRVNQSLPLRTAIVVVQLDLPRPQ